MKHIDSADLYGTVSQRAGGVWVVEDEFDATVLLSWLSLAVGPVGIDCETEGVDLNEESPVGRGEIVCWSLAWRVESEMGISQIERAYLPGALLGAFKRYLAKAPLVGHNIWRFDRHMFDNHGVRLGNIVGDTLRMSQMHYNVKGYSHGLKDLSRRWLGYEMRDYADLFSRPKPGKPGAYKKVAYRRPTLKSVLRATELWGRTKEERSLYGGEYQLIKWGKTAIIPLSEVIALYPERARALVDYASLDAKCTLELYYALNAALAKVPARDALTLADVHRDFWNPVCRVVSNSEARGITLDSEVCRVGEAKARADIAGIEDRLSAWARRPDMNWGSADQLRELLYYDFDMPLPPIKGTIKGIKPTSHGERSTAEASLYWLELNARNDSERTMLGLIRARRKATRLAGYLRDLPGFVAPDGRLHGVMGPDTTTGRLAVRLPPLQQMPGKEPYGIRRAFTAAPGKLLVVADYSQLEVYILAHMLFKLFGDTAVADALASGDVYGAIAKLCWPNKSAGVEARDIKHHPDPEVRKLRDLAKVVVLATNYGKTPQGLAISLLDETGQSVGLDYAIGLLATYGKAFPGVVRFQEWSATFARTHRGIYTIAGRWRPIPEANSTINSVRNRGARIASNTPIQGSAMDITGAAMVDIENDPELLVLGAQQLLQVHDELIVEVPEQHAEQALARVSHLMTVPRFGMQVQLKVEAKVARTWAEGK